jgi:DNA-directed RNA polymerase subunit K/omega
MSNNSKKTSSNKNNEEAVKEEAKEETKEEAKEETKEEAKAEVAEETKAEVAEETKAEVAEETKAEVVEETKAEVAEETKEAKEDLTNYFGETKESIFLKESLLDVENTDIQLSSDDEEEEIVKIENNIEYNILDKYHPEIKQLNNNELNSKIIIKRNKDGVINDVNHTTLPIMTRYERAKIIGLRATQINSGADVLIDIPDNIIDGITIAKMELVQKKIPFIIRRPLPNGKSEYWDINDLEIIE